MGLLSDLVAIKKVQRIMKGEISKLSISQVTFLITNMQEAKKNLTPEEFNKVYRLFNKLRKCTTKIEMNKIRYYQVSMDIIKKFEKIAPYIKYSGGNEVEMSFLMDEIKKSENEKKEMVDKLENEELEEIIKKDIEIILKGAQGQIEYKEAEEFVNIIITYQTDNNLFFTTFNKFIISLINDNPINATFKVAYFHGILKKNGILSEEEMKESIRKYTKIIIDRIK